MKRPGRSPTLQRIPGLTLAVVLFLFGAAPAAAAEKAEVDPAGLAADPDPGQSPYLPAEGWPVGAPMDLRSDEGRDALHRHESPHFVVYTTVGGDCARRIAEHAEVFYARIAPLFPGAFYDPMMESRVEVRFFAYPKERAAFEGARRGTKRWSHYYYVDAVDCLGVPVGDDAAVTPGGRVRIHVRALQHELTHGVTARYFGDNGRDQPLALAEGLARYFERWDVTRGRDENLRRIPQEFGGNLVQIVAMFEGVDAGHAWIPLDRLLTENRFDWGGTPYQQGFALAAFFLSEPGRAHWKRFCRAYRRFHHLLTPAGREAAGRMLTDEETAELRAAFRAYVRDELVPLADDIAGPGWRARVRRLTATDRDAEEDDRE
jgi:hypothetical protein